MCGIFGWALPAERALSEAKLSALTDELFHRGPDASGHWLRESHDRNWQIGLGHRRLSIIDLSPAGAQPMHGEGGRVLIFNGEIYNYIELRRELEAEGVEFSGRGDTEVLLRLLMRHGSAALSKLRGMFAFAYWDGASELVLGRDQFGKKPLYLAELADGGLAFGSELTALTHMPGVDQRFDWDSLPEYLEYRYVPGPHTFFQGIKKLPPGHVAVWKRGRLTMERFFTPPFAFNREKPFSDREAEQRFSETLKEAVSIRLRSDAPFGAFLSGGIDSATVVGLMTQELSRPVRTFSVGFDESEYSELRYARQVAEHFHADHSEIIVPATAVIDHLPEAVLRRGAPVSEASDVPILLLSKMASQSVKMVLTGEGSDELLGGYPKHRADGLVTAYQHIFPGFLHRAIVEPLARYLPYSARRAAIVLRAAGEREPEARMAAWFGATTKAEREALLIHADPKRSLDQYPFSSQSTALKRILFFDQTSWLPDNLLERGDRMMMAGSIEGRMPFMDVELARLVASFPDRFLTGQKGGKAILRRTMGAMLPPEIISRKKVGFRVPINLWFRSSLKDYLLDHLTGPSAMASQLYRKPALEALIHEHLKGQRNHEKLLWALLNLEIFVRQLKPSFR